MRVHQLATDLGPETSRPTRAICSTAEPRSRLSTSEATASSSAAQVPRSAQAVKTPNSRDKIRLISNDDTRLDQLEEDEPELTEITQAQLDQAKVTLVRLVSYLVHQKVRAVPNKKRLRTYTMSCLGEVWPLAKLFLDASYFRQNFRIQVTRDIFTRMLQGTSWENIVPHLPAISQEALLSAIGSAASLLADIFASIPDDHSLLRLHQGRRKVFKQTEFGQVVL